jgi:hypothetical protein
MRGGPEGTFKENPVIPSATEIRSFPRFSPRPQQSLASSLAAIGLHPFVGCRLLLLYQPMHRKEASKSRQHGRTWSWAVPRVHGSVDELVKESCSRGDPDTFQDRGASAHRICRSLYGIRYDEGLQWRDSGRYVLISHLSPVGTRLWRIVCLGVHFSLSSDKPQDALHHQRQVLLRNAADPESGFVAFSNLAWAWKGRGTKTATRLGGLMILSLAWFFGFVFLGGFSSLVANAAGDQVLLVGDACSVKAVEVPDDLAQSDLDRIKRYEALRVMDAANMARKCSELDGGDRGEVRCSPLAVNRVPLAVRNLTAGCPFSADVCQPGNANILLDTGLMDSHDHLGINSPRRQRFGYRRRLHCAPLKTEPYKQDLSVPGERRAITQYFYGRQWDAANEEVFTYEYENHLSNTTRGTTPIDFTIG